MSSINKSQGWTFALFVYQPTPLIPSRFGEFRRFFSDVLREWGVDASHVAADGNGYAGKYVKLGSDAAAKVEQRQYAGVEFLSVAACRTDRPGFDSVAHASLGWCPPDEILLSMTSLATVTSLESELFNRVLINLLALHQWSFGFGVSGDVEKTQLYAAGASDGRLSPSEAKTLSRWYSADSRTRQALPRDVYQLNIWNNQQMTGRSSAGSITDALRSFPSISIRRVGDLSIVIVPPDDVIALRMLLCDAELLLAPNIHGM